MSMQTESRQSGLSRALACIQNVTAFVSALMLVLMMGVTVVDTLGRYFFNRPLAGAAEWIELTMGLIVFAGMYQATHHREHVRLDLFDRFWSPRAAWLVQTAASFISMLIMLMLAWQLWEKVVDLHEFNDVSAYLGVPLAPVGLFMLVMIALSAVVYLTQMCSMFKKDA